MRDSIDAAVLTKLRVKMSDHWKAEKLKEEYKSEAVFWKMYLGYLDQEAQGQMKGESVGEKAITYGRSDGALG
ncbi:hypothetical protein BDV96DRAFT_591603 [Lophiotrema nucula]|uniref:Uncharacterized protein n=1 Tax=Lophiotrema nucula TaxID=690887 RepID=A0A6A5YIJ0_9PLEO|nr:hypothetical protein BDV96DRAFT_591603 [Lophiotrema nucula]